MNIKKRVRENIKRLRLEAGLSQQKLADKTGKSLRYINYLERNDSNVTIEVLEVLAKAMGVSISSLISNNEECPNSNDLRPGLAYLRTLINEKLGELESDSDSSKDASASSLPPHLRPSKKKLKKQS